MRKQQRVWAEEQAANAKQEGGAGGGKGNKKNKGSPGESGGAES